MEPTTEEEDELMDSVHAELLALRGKTLRLSLDAVTALSVIACIQVGLRHPGNVGEVSERSRLFVAKVAEEFPPAMREMVNRGFRP